MNQQSYITLILFHILISIAVFIFRPFGKLFFIIAAFYFLLRIFLVDKNKKVIEVLLGCAYFVGAEVFFRMTKSGLAYEASKYLVILFVLLGMFFKGVSGKGYPYFLYLILLVPAVLVASITLSFDANFRTNIAFVLSGPVCLGIAALFCYDRKVSIKDMHKIVLYMLLPLVTTTTYLFLYNPSVKEKLSGTASNSALSGGFGPNQVATVLGLGMFLMVIRLFMKSPSLVLKIINLVVLGGMTFRAIVTFSRGGILAAIIVVAVFLWILYFRSSIMQKSRIIGSFILFVFAIILTWIISSNQTMGLIDKRYANQDALGREKSDITTGRIDLLEEEIEGFLGNPFLGIGTSKIKDIRVETDGRNLPSHNEIGRLLSEHGLLGIVCILILIFAPLSYYSRNNKNIFFYAFLAFWFATINHSGMRIAAPAFIYALALLNVTYDKKPPIHRQQIKG